MPRKIGADGAEITSGEQGADGQGVPVGGTTDQMLAKASSSDFDTAWIDPPAFPAGGITDEILVKNSVTNYDAGWQTLKVNGGFF